MSKPNVSYSLAKSLGKSTNKSIEFVVFIRRCFPHTQKKQQ